MTLATYTTHSTAIFSIALLAAITLWLTWEAHRESKARKEWDSLREPQRFFDQEIH